MLPVRLRPEALRELGEAWQWYEERREGLGDEFRACVDASLAAIARAPLESPLIRGGARRKIVKRFPYVIIYLAEPGHIEVLAVLHSARDPKRWAKRTSS